MKNLALWLALLFVKLPVLSAFQSGAEPRQPNALSVEEALRVRSFSPLTDVQFSPDGKWISFTIQDNLRSRSVDDREYALTGIPAWAMGTDIYVVNTETGEMFSLTAGKGNNWLPVWSYDGRYLAFASDRESNGQARLWIWNVMASRLEQLSDIGVRTEAIEWTPDSRGVIVTAVPKGLSVSNSGSITSALDGRDSRRAPMPGVLHYESHPGFSDPTDQPSPAWNLDENLKDLCLVDISTGAVTTIVRSQRVASFRVSPDGLRVGYSSPTHFERPGSQQILFDLITLDLKTTAKQRISTDLRLGYDGSSFSWSPDSQHLAFQTGGPEEHWFDCYVSDLVGIPRKLTSFPQPALVRRKSEPPIWGRNGDVYFLRDGAIWRAHSRKVQNPSSGGIPDRQIVRILPSGREFGSSSVLVLTRDDIGKQDGIYSIDMTTGTSTRLLEQGQCYTCSGVRRPFVQSKDGRRFAFLSEDAQHDQDLWIVDASFTKPHRLTHLNPQFDKLRMGAARLISWLGDDGDQLRGTLLLPADYQPGKRYPLVVWVYGGVLLSDDFDRFGGAYRGPFNMQLLATRGYAVLMPDAPQRLGTPMLDLVKTVLPGINKVIEMGIADSDRLGIMGHSYGGYSTLALIVQTQRFKAAIEACGPADLLGNYGAMNKDGTAFGISIDESGQGLMGGTPWQVRSRYIENSPFFYLDRVGTPLLIIQGGSDDSVAPFLADQLFVSLRRLGKPVEYVRYEDEEHSPVYWTYSHQVDMCTRILAWLDRYLKGRELHE